MSYRLRWLRPWSLANRRRSRRRPPARRAPRLEFLETRWLLHGGGDEPHDHPPAHSPGDHIHAQLAIFIDGPKQVIPANIGIGPGGHVSFLHTHDATGLLHLEPLNAQAPADFLTVDDFFGPWRTNAGLAGNNPNAVFNENQILGSVADAGHVVRMFVNGAPASDFDDYVIHDQDNIVISFLPVVTPSPFHPVATLGTNFGPIPIELYTDSAPVTTNNFLEYVTDGDYVNSIFHRSLPGFVIQAGGFTSPTTEFTSAAQFGQVPTDPAIVNEPGISNTRGTVAMAKLGGDPNSATSQFFVNLADNSANLDAQNGGFTVFGRVLDMTMADVIAALATSNLDAAQGLTDVPLTADNMLAVIQSVQVTSTAAEAGFVAKLYQDLLGRAAADPEVLSWVRRIQDGASREEVVRDVRSAPEFQRQLANGFYQRFLDRQGEEGGLDFWVGLLAQGEQVEVILIGFLESREYFVLNGNSPAGFVAAMYDELFGRAADAQASAFWETSLERSSERWRLAQGLAYSQELRGAAIDEFYTDWLGRPSDPAGRDFWLGHLPAEDFLDQLGIGLLGSPEYAAG